MLPIATEVLTVTEQNPGQFVSIVNDDFFAERGIRNPTKPLKAMLTIARHKLLQEIGSADRTRTIDQTVHRNFRSSVFSASFLLDEDMELMFLTYFGERVERSTSYVSALIHVLEVLDALENDLGEESRPRRFGSTLSATVQPMAQPKS